MTQTSHRVRKAVFPVAGLGTRFLPATKAMPKEMLPVVDRPLIQHVVDEAREAGIEHFIFVTGRNKGVIEDHFDRQFELEMTLLERQKQPTLDCSRAICPAPAPTSFTRQQEPLGLGHAVWCARELVGNEPFALLLPDVLVQHERGCLAQMMDERARSRGKQYRRRRGGAAPSASINTAWSASASAKASCSRSPAWWKSRRAIARRPISFSPAATSCSRRSSSPREQERGAGGEIQLTDAMIQLAKTQPFYGLQFEGRSFDCGSKIGFLSANVAYALARDDIAPGFRAEIKKFLGN